MKESPPAGSFRTYPRAGFHPSISSVADKIFDQLVALQLFSLHLFGEIITRYNNFIDKVRKFRIRYVSCRFCSRKLSTCITCVQYRGACNTVRAVQYRAGYLVPLRDIMINVGDILSTIGVFSTVGGYHEYRGSILSTVGIS